MNFIKSFINFSDVLGFLLLVLGFFLIPFFIGVPIFIGGILLLVFNFYKKWFDIFVPKDTQEKIAQELKKSYLPFQSAFRSMKIALIDIGKTSGLVFIFLTITVSAIFLAPSFFGRQSYWICDKNGAWIKQGNPTYPSPIVSCTNKTPLPNNKDDCLSGGGVWVKQGPEPFETCNRKAIDRGNLCRDNGECEGVCQVELTKDELSQGMKGELNINNKVGQCSVWVVELGCYGIIKQGKSQVICVD